MIRGTALFAAGTLLSVGTAFAQHGPPPSGTGMGVPGSNNSSARPEEMSEHDSSSLTSTLDQIQHGVRKADTDRAAALARAGGRAVPARPSDIIAAAAVFDMTGQTVGTVETADADGAVIVTNVGKVKIPLNAFGKNKLGLVISLSKQDFETLVAKANAAPVG